MADFRIRSAEPAAETPRTRHRRGSSDLPEPQALALQRTRTPAALVRSTGALQQRIEQHAQLIDGRETWRNCFSNLFGH